MAYHVPPGVTRTPEGPHASDLSNAEVAVAYLPLVLDGLDADAAEKFAFIMQVTREVGYKEGFKAGCDYARNNS